MKTFERLLLENKAWSEEKKLHDPGYFERLAADHKPEFLWIGCADSRVPADIILNADPGVIFSHRNIANQVIATDFNCLSVIQYAVQALKIKHIIVCGHYDCGGIKASLDHQHPEFTILNKWLLHVKDVYRLHREELDAIESIQDRANRLVELNVIEQVQRLAYTSIVQTAWRSDQRPMLHGWVFAMQDGLLKQLIVLTPESDIDDIYRWAVPDPA